MNKWKALRRFSAVIVTIAVVLTGCGGGDKAAGDQTNGGKASGGSGKQETVEFWVNWGGDFKKDYQKYVIDEFEKKFPNIKVSTFAA